MSEGVPDTRKLEELSLEEATAMLADVEASIHDGMADVLTLMRGRRILEGLIKRKTPPGAG